MIWHDHEQHICFNQSLAVHNNVVTCHFNHPHFNLRYDIPHDVFLSHVQWTPTGPALPIRIFPEPWRDVVDLLNEGRTWICTDIEEGEIISSTDDDSTDDSASDSTDSEDDEIMSSTDDDSTDDAVAVSEPLPSFTGWVQQRMQLTYLHHACVRKNVRCCVCEEAFVAYVDDNFVMGRQLSDISGPQDMFGLADVYLNPCQMHYTCRQCLVRLLTEFIHVEVDQYHSRFRCQCRQISPACSDCVYEWEDFRYLLSEGAYSRLLRAVAPFSRPGHDAVPCPSCESMCFVPRSLVDTVEVGKLSFKCDACVSHFCFDCHEPFNGVCCDTCRYVDNYKNPLALNPYYPPKNERHYYKNRDITSEMAIAFVDRCLLRDHQSMYNQCCKGCGIALHKTEMCNEVVHCGMHQCYHCGFCSSGPIPSSHWADGGVRAIMTMTSI